MNEKPWIRERACSDARAYVRVKVDMCRPITANLPIRLPRAEERACGASPQLLAAGVGDSTGAALHSSRYTEPNDVLPPNVLLSAPRILAPSSCSAALPSRPLSLRSSLQAIANQFPDSASGPPTQAQVPSLLPTASQQLVILLSLPCPYTRFP